MLMQCVFTESQEVLKYRWSRENKIMKTGLKIRGSENRCGVNTRGDK